MQRLQIVIWLGRKYQFFYKSRDFIELNFDIHVNLDSSSFFPHLGGHLDMMSSLRGEVGISQQMTIDDKGGRGGP